MSLGVVAVVVTHNRPDYLDRCLAALREQVTPPTHTVVIDNASDEATRSLLAQHPEVVVHRLPENLGGAGGFAEGMRVARRFDPNWYWLMDDDCLPNPDALETLLSADRRSPERRTGGIAPAIQWSSGDVMCGFLRDGRRSVDGHADWAPFAGLLLKRAACDEVGDVRQDFFIWNDDHEYGLRLRRAGWSFLCSPDAIVHHPSRRPRLKRRIFGCSLEIPDLAPWREYYSVRNSLIVALLDAPTRRARMRVRVRTLKVELARWMQLLLVTPTAGTRIGFRLRGLIDGLRGRTGRTVAPG